MSMYYNRNYSPGPLSDYSRGLSYSNYNTDSLPSRIPSVQRVIDSDFGRPERSRSPVRDYSNSVSRLSGFRPITSALTGETSPVFRRKEFTPAEERGSPISRLGGDDLNYSNVKSRSYFDHLSIPSSSYSSFTAMKKPKRIDYSDYLRPTMQLRPFLKSGYVPSSTLADREKSSAPIVRERKLIKFREIGNDVFTSDRRRMSWDLPEEIDSPLINEMKRPDADNTNNDIDEQVKSRESSLKRAGSKEKQAYGASPLSVSPRTSLSRRSSGEQSLTRLEAREKGFKSPASSPLSGSPRPSLSRRSSGDPSLDRTGRRKLMRMRSPSGCEAQTDANVSKQIPIVPPRKKSIGSTAKFKNARKSSVGETLEERNLKYSVIADEIKRNRELRKSIKIDSKEDENAIRQRSKREESNTVSNDNLYQRQHEQEVQHVDSVPDSSITEHIPLHGRRRRRRISIPDSAENKSEETRSRCRSRTRSRVQEDAGNKDEVDSSVQKSDNQSANDSYSFNHMHRKSVKYKTESLLPRRSTRDFATESVGSLSPHSRVKDFPAESAGTLPPRRKSKDFAPEPIGNLPPRRKSKDSMSLAESTAALPPRRKSKDSVALVDSVMAVSTHAKSQNSMELAESIALPPRRKSKDCTVVSGSVGTNMPRRKSKDSTESGEPIVPTGTQSQRPEYENKAKNTHNMASGIKSNKALPEEALKVSNKNIAIKNQLDVKEKSDLDKKSKLESVPVNKKGFQSSRPTTNQKVKTDVHLDQQSNQDHSRCKNLKLNSTEKCTESKSKGIGEKKTDSDITDKIQPSRTEKESNEIVVVYKLPQPKKNSSGQVISADSEITLNKNIPEQPHVVVSIVKKDASISAVHVIDKSSETGVGKTSRSNIPTKKNSSNAADILGTNKIVPKVCDIEKTGAAAKIPDINVTHTVVLKHKNQNSNAVATKSDSKEPDECFHLKSIPDVIKSTIRTDTKSEDRGSVSDVVKSTLNAESYAKKENSLLLPNIKKESDDSGNKISEIRKISTFEVKSDSYHKLSKIKSDGKISSEIKKSVDSCKKDVHPYQIPGTECSLKGNLLSKPDSSFPKHKEISNEETLKNLHAKPDVLQGMSFSQDTTVKEKLSADKAVVGVSSNSEVSHKEKLNAITKPSPISSETNDSSAIENLRNQKNFRSKENGQEMESHKIKPIYMKSFTDPNVNTSLKSCGNSKEENISNLSTETKNNADFASLSSGNIPNRIEELKLSLPKLNKSMGISSNDSKSPPDCNLKLNYGKEKLPKIPPIRKDITDMECQKFAQNLLIKESTVKTELNEASVPGEINQFAKTSSNADESKNLNSATSEGKQNFTVACKSSKSDAKLLDEVKSDATSKLAETSETKASVTCAKDIIENDKKPVASSHLKIESENKIAKTGAAHDIVDYNSAEPVAHKSKSSEMVNKATAVKPTKEITNSASNAKEVFKDEKSSATSNQKTGSEIKITDFGTKPYSPNKTITPNSAKLEEPVCNKDITSASSKITALTNSSLDMKVSSIDGKTPTAISVPKIDSEKEVTNLSKKSDSGNKESSTLNSAKTRTINEIKAATPKSIHEETTNSNDSLRQLSKNEKVPSPVDQFRTDSENKKSDLVNKQADSNAEILSAEKTKISVEISPNDQSILISTKPNSNDEKRSVSSTCLHVDKKISELSKNIDSSSSMKENSLNDTRNIKMEIFDSKTKDISAESKEQRIECQDSATVKHGEKLVSLAEHPSLSVCNSQDNTKKSIATILLNTSLSENSVSGKDVLSAKCLTTNESTIPLTPETKINSSDNKIVEMIPKSVGEHADKEGSHDVKSETPKVTAENILIHQQSQQLDQLSQNEAKGPKVDMNSVTETNKMPVSIESNKMDVNIPPDKGKGKNEKPPLLKKTNEPKLPPVISYRYGLFLRPKDPEPVSRLLESSTSSEDEDSDSSYEECVGKSPEREDKGRSRSETSHASIYSNLSTSTTCTTFSTSDDEYLSPVKAQDKTRKLKFRKYEIDDFAFLKLLGKGSFGKVMLAELKDSEMYFAIKCLKKDVVLEDDDVESTMIERRVLALGTQHPYMCKLYCTFQTESYLFFVMEYLNGGDLMFHIQNCRRFEEKRAMFYAAEIVSALKFLHKRGIIYRDIKLDNVLLDQEGHVRLVDFGMCQCRIYQEECMPSNFCGTPSYIAPEIILGQKYGQSVDWWSFGILLYEMMNGRSPFHGTDEDELFWSICNEEPYYPWFLSKEAKHILGLLLVKLPSKRLGMPSSPAGDIRDHAFFSTINWDKLEKKQIQSPFKPTVLSACDTSNFDSSFTMDCAVLSPVDSEMLESMDQEQFKGFSYTNPHITS